MLKSANGREAVTAGPPLHQDTNTHYTPTPHPTTTQPPHTTQPPTPPHQGYSGYSTVRRHFGGGSFVRRSSSNCLARASLGAS